jgi:hypothetical protein
VVVVLCGGGDGVEEMMSHIVTMELMLNSHVRIMAGIFTSPMEFYQTFHRF